MKKMFVIGLCAGILFSCNTKSSDKEKSLQAPIDSLEAINQKGTVEVADMMSLINEVEENFNQIKAAEKYLTIESQSSGELTPDARTKVQENFKMINEILKKNKESMAVLNKRMAKNKGELSALKSTIERLNQQLQESATTITSLQTALAGKDQQIAKLSNDVKDLSANIQSLSQTNVVQAEKIKEQDKAINSAYYMFGTTKELKEAKVVSGGFLVSPKLMRESVDKEKFIKIDIRNTREIPVYDKKAKVLSDHPLSSYSIVKDMHGNAIIRISDYQKFWSLTSFLIIEVN